MPIFEFKCKKCKNTFEELVLSSAEEKEMSCPKCGSGNTEKLMSTFRRGKSSDSFMSMLNGAQPSSSSSCSASSCSSCSST